MTNQITIEVTLTPNDGKPTGYQFGYASTSGLVAPDGTVDLSNYDKEDVVLLFKLLPIQGMQPMFAVDPALPPPKETEEAIWFEAWPWDQPPPAPCPASHGHANSAFRAFSLPQPNQLQFTDKNKDKKRYAYALRCVVPPSPQVVVDDPVIINKIAQGPA